MSDKLYKYAELLLKKGLSIKSGQPLLLHAPVESIEFVRIITEVACKLGVNDIYYDFVDDELMNLELEYFDMEHIRGSKFWNKEIYDEYAKRDGAFLFLISSSEYSKEISSSKLICASRNSLETRKLYCLKQENNNLDWCIATVATKKWANKVFQNDKNDVSRLWDVIFDICLINKEDPMAEWDKYILVNKERCNTLNNLNIKTLHYTNKLGTDLYITLDKKAIWCGGASDINGRELLVNIPTIEVFTTPNKYMTNGRVFCKMPLVHQGTVINDIFLEFKDGKVTSFSSKTGEDELKNIISFDSESSMLGEVALVSCDSPIYKSNLLFYETLFDENAASHIALGRGFKECLDNGFLLNEKELDEIGYNKSQNHVDIMIGTDDLNISAVTYDDTEVEIFKDGRFVI